MDKYSAPAWSFPGRYKQQKASKDPGPGAYNAKNYDKHNHPNFKIGTELRDKYYNPAKDNPAPGAYDPHPIGQPLSSVFGSSKRGPLTPNTKNPGPGAYSSTGGLLDAPFTMKGKYGSSDNLRSPGPGQYNPGLSGSQPSFSMGSGQRGGSKEDGVRNHFPGPGSYQDKGKNDAPKWGFGSESRTNINKNDNPPPGQYEAPSTLSKRAASMKGDRTQRKGENKPGPGAYNPHFASGAPQWSVGGESRGGPQYQNAFPGPGTYDPQLGSPAGSVFGKSYRGPLSPNPKNPGPGAYDTVGDLNGSQNFTMKGRHQGSSTTLNSPGPGEYSPNKQSYNPSYGMGTGKRGAQKSDIQKFPGPGSYTYRPSSQGPRWKFGTNKRSHFKRNENPGPGTYQYKSQLSHRSVSMKGGRMKDRKSQQPGPGAYDVQGKVGSPQWSMGNEQRPGIKGTGQSPGPGAYDPNLQGGGNQFQFGTGNRPPLSSVQPNPGPGAYEFYDSPQGSKNFTMKGKYNSTGGLNAPGPGQYNPNLSNTQIQWSMGREKRQEMAKDQVRNKFPGPGSYNPKTGKCCFKCSSGGWTFGREKRGRKIKNNNPGAGSYEMKSTISNLPSYALPH